MLQYGIILLLFFRKDTFRSDRATGEPSDAHNSNFLHPVFYFYKHPPKGNYTVFHWSAF